MKASLIGLVVLLGMAGLLFAEEGIGSSGNIKEWIVLQPDTYKIKARVSLKTEKYLTVTKSLDLTWDIPDSVPGASEKGWIKKSGDWLWVPGTKSSPLAVPLTRQAVRGSDTEVPSSDQSIPVADFNQLWLDYIDYFDSPCEISLALILESDKAIIAATGVRQFRLKAEEIIDVAHAIWKEKNKFYLAKRELGLPFDENWRYDQDGENVVLQRRFHKDISRVAVVDLVFSPETPVKEVNLRLGFKDRPRWSALALWNTFQKRVLIEKGQKIVRIWLGENLLKSFPDKKKIFLEEIIVHLPGQTGDVSRKRPFERLIFYDYDIDEEAKNTRAINIEPRIEEKSGGNMRMLIDLPMLLSRISDSNTRDNISNTRDNIRFKKAMLYASPSNPEQSCGFRLKRIRLVETYEEKRPFFIKPLKEMTERLEIPLKEDEKVVPIWLMPLSSEPELIRKGQRSKDKTVFFNSISGERVFQVRWISPDRDSPFKVFPERGGIRVEGTASYLRLTYPVSIKVNPNYKYKFWLGMSGNVEAVLSSTLILKQGRGTLKVPFRPNVPVSLPDLTGVINGLDIALEIEGSPVNMTFNEGIIYQLKRMNYEDMFLSAPALEHSWIKLMPDCPESGRDMLWNCSEDSNTLVVLDEPEPGSRVLLTFPVNMPLKSVDWLRFSYHVPWQVPAFDPQWLTLKVEGDNRAVKKRVSLKRPKGNAGIYLPALLGSDWPMSEKILRISFIFSPLSDIGTGQKPLTYSIGNISVRTSGLQTWQELLAKYPLLTINGHPIYLPFINKAQVKGLLEGNLWIDLGDFAIEETAPEISLRDHPSVKVEAVVLEGASSAKAAIRIGKGRKGEIIDKQMGKGIGRTDELWKYLRRFVVFGIIIISVPFIWLSWRKGWLQWIIGIFRDTISTVFRRLDIFLYKRRGFLLIGSWMAIAAAFYYIGLSSKGKDDLGFSLGSIFLFLAFRSAILIVRPWLQRRWPNMTDKIYGEAGNYYLVGFMLTLIGAALLLIVKLEPIAEQLAVVGYYCLIAGVVLKAWAIKKEQKDKKGEGIDR